MSTLQDAIHTLLRECGPMSTGTIAALVDGDRGPRDVLRSCNGLARFGMVLRIPYIKSGQKAYLWADEDDPLVRP